MLISRIIVVPATSRMLYIGFTLLVSGTSAA